MSSKTWVLSVIVMVGDYDILTIHDMLHTSVLAPHFAPRMTSGDLYCLVWISFVKWWLTQHALPRSAILTEMVSIAKSSAILVGDVPSLLDEFPRSMPETLLARMSLDLRISS